MNTILTPETEKYLEDYLLRTGIDLLESDFFELSNHIFEKLKLQITRNLEMENNDKNDYIKLFYQCYCKNFVEDNLNVLTEQCIDFLPEDDFNDHREKLIEEMVYLFSNLGIVIDITNDDLDIRHFHDLYDFFILNKEIFFSKFLSFLIHDDKSYIKSFAEYLNKVSPNELKNNINNETKKIIPTYLSIKQMVDTVFNKLYSSFQDGIFDFTSDITEYEFLPIMFINNYAYIEDQEFNYYISYLKKSDSIIKVLKENNYICKIIRMAIKNRFKN